MDGFTYHDIFQTKGIEYLIIISFLILLVPFWAIINKRKEIGQRIQEALGIFTMKILKIPKGVLFNRNHTWAHLKKSGIAEVGLDDWLLHLAGDVKFNYLRAMGENIAKGDLLTEIANEGKVLRVYSPISGKVLRTNPKTDESPASIIDDPYSEGWIYKIEPSNWKAETSSFYFGEEAAGWFKKEIDRFKDFIAVSVGKNNPEASAIVLQEGGELCDHALSELPEIIWNDFQKEFLNENQ